MEKSKGGISVAAILSIVGWLVCVIFAGLGLYVRGYDLLVAVGASAGMLILGGVGYYIGVKAKLTENEFKKWRTYEYLGVAMMVASLAVAVMPFCWGINFMADFSDMRRAAEQDKVQVDALVDRYRTLETARLNRTAEGLKNFVRTHSANSSEALDIYVLRVVMMNQGGYLNSAIVDDFEEFNAAFIERGAVDDYPIDRLVNSIDSILFVTRTTEYNSFKDVQQSFDVASGNLTSFFNQMSASLDLPVVTLSGEKFTVADSTPNSYEVVKSSFGEIYDRVFEIGSLNLLVFAFVAILALLHYLCEYHTYVVNKLPPVSDKDGILL